MKKYVPFGRLLRPSTQPLEEKTHEIGDFEDAPVTHSILVLDDDADLALLIRDFLEKSDYEVYTAQHGVEGLKHIMHKDFDVILCDMTMPKLPGDLFYLAVEKMNPKLCGRFIFMTSENQESHREFIRKVRGNILWKPFRFENLTTAISNVIKRYHETI